jgi:hemerythrin superfamily protein
MNAASLLKRDHRNVEALFDEYRSAPPDSKRTILENITRELTKHMLAEEGVLYPVLRTFVPDGEILMEDAVEEHKEAKGLLAELENAVAGSFEMDSKVATLRRAIDHHVRQEEGVIFPRMEQMLGATPLEELGAQVESANLRCRNGDGCGRPLKKRRLGKGLKHERAPARLWPRNWRVAVRTWTCALATT